MTDRYESRATTHADKCWSWGPKHYECAVREIKALRADLKESEEIREKLGHLLTRTAKALKGEPPEGTWHSWHDLPENAAQLAEALRDGFHDLRKRAETSWQRGFQHGLGSNRLLAMHATDALKKEREAHAETNRAMTDALLMMEEREQRDEALLRQALEALLGQRGEPDWHTGKQRENAIAALRERLGDEKG